jgi:MATE family multidrug resistance protein
MSNGLPQPESWWSRPAGGREVLQIALPMVVTTLSWTLMQFVDSAILMYTVSDTAMAAAYTGGITWFSLMSLLYGLCSYGSTFVAQFYGDGQPHKVGQVVWQGAWLALAFIPFIPIGYYLAPHLFRWFEHAPELARMETVFFQTLCFGAPGMLAGQSLEAFYSGRGKTWVVMIVDSAAVLVNLVLAFMLVGGLGGIESMGIVGAAWSTVLAQWFRAFTYAALLLRQSNREEFHTWRWLPDLQLIRRLIRFGGPSGVQMMLDIVGFNIFLLLISRLGLVEAAASSLAFRISQVAFMPVWGFGMATAVLVGQKLGEDSPELAQRAARTALGLCMAYMGTISLLFTATPDIFLQSFFLHDGDPTASLEAVRAMTIHLMKFVAAYNLFDAAVIIFVSVLRGAGDTRFVMATSICMSAMLVIATALGVSELQFNVLGRTFILNLNVYGCWTIITADVWLLALIYYFRYRLGKWKQMRVIDQVHHGHGHGQTVPGSNCQAHAPATAPPEAAVVD